MKTKIAASAPDKLPPDLEEHLERILSRVPPFFSLPKPKTRCPYTSESRTGLVELITPCERNRFNPPVKAIYKKSHKHAQRGRWLIPSENIFRYLLSLEGSSVGSYLEMSKARAAE
jgi:hypothetical protein